MPRQTKGWIASLIFGIAIIIIGIYFLFQTDKVINALVLLVGALAVASGIHTLVAFSAYRDKNFSLTASTVRAVANIIVGVLAIVVTVSQAGPSWMTIILYVLAADMALSGLVSIWDAIRLHRLGFPVVFISWEAVGTICISVLLFLFPNFFARFAGIVIGLVIICFGLVRVLLSLAVRSAAQNAPTVVIEGEFEEKT